MLPPLNPTWQIGVLLMYHVRIAPGGIRTRDNLLGRQEPLTTRRLMHEIEKESGGGLEPLQPSLASTRWRMGHPPIVRVIPKLVAPAGFEPTHKESESSVLPDYTKEQLNRLVVPLGFAPRPYTFKGCRTAIIPWNIVEKGVMCQGVEPRMLAILTYDSDVPPCSIHITS